MSNLTKATLIKKVAENENIDARTAAVAVDATFAIIQSALRNGEKVQIHGFGTFSTKERAARTGRNPATGATIQIAASTSVKFKPASNFL